MKTGQVTNEDVEEYIQQVGLETLRSMSLAPADVKEYLKNVTELGNKPKKKKLPSKNKINKDDSMLVVDGNDNVSKVKADSESLTFESLAKKTAEKSLDLGTTAFNKVFPGLGKFIGFVKNKFEDQTKTAAQTNASILGYSREVNHSSDLLDSIVQSGERTNLILNRILAASRTNNRQPSAQTTPSPSPAPAPAPQAPPPSASAPTTRTPTPAAPAPAASPTARTTQAAPPPASTATPVSAPPAAAPNRSAMIGAGITVAGGAAMVAAGGGGATPNRETANASTNADAELLAEGSGRFQYRGAAGNLLVEYSHADGKFKIDNTEVDRAVYLRFMQLARLTGTRSEQNHPRYQQFLQEARAADDLMPEASAREKVRDLNIQELISLVNQVRNPTATPASNVSPGAAPLAPARTGGAAMSSAAAASAPSIRTPVASTSVATPIETPSATSTQFDSRLLHIKAKKITFKAERFEYSGGTQTPAAGVTASGGGFSPPPISNQPSGGGSATQTGAADISGLEFAGGVDQRIKPDVAEKTKSVQSAFGKKLLVTSGFRDPGRNARAGGAEGSKHLTGDAVDVQFQGNEQDTINLIKVASEKGMGGIGVYRPGFLHLDTGSKRVWGPDYKASSIPQWAKPALDEHMGRPSSAASGGNATGAGGGESTPAATPVSAPPASTASPSSSGGSSPSPAASAVPPSPSSGAAVSRASVADEAATRTPPAIPTPTAQGGAAPASTPSPSLPAIDPNDPGEVEPPDAALRYARLFGMAA